MQSIPGVHNANQWGSYEQIDKKCPDLHQSEHLDSRVEAVVFLLMCVLHPLHVVREGPVATSLELGSYTLNLLDREW